jgi:hypothetical protein
MSDFFISIYCLNRMIIKQYGHQKFYFQNGDFSFFQQPFLFTVTFGIGSLDDVFSETEEKIQNIP